jgi:hypothetical protein
MTTDPSSAGDLLGQDATGEHAKQDEILARIETQNRLPAWCWPPMSETVARLRDLGDDLAWVATRYLQTVLLRGEAVFGDPINYQTGLWQNENRPTLTCRCGHDAPADPRRKMGRDREFVAAECDVCGIVQVVFDGIPHPGPTLITAALL